MLPNLSYYLFTEQQRISAPAFLILSELSTWFKDYTYLVKSQDKKTAHDHLSAIAGSREEFHLRNYPSKG